MMIFLRALGLILLFPTLAGRPLPVMLRSAIAVCLATLLYTLVPHVTAIPGALGGLIAASACEVALGLVMGWVGRLVFAAVEMGGRVISSEIGLTAIPGIDAPQPAQEPVATLLVTFAGMMFFIAGGHLGSLAAFARSFDFAPAGAAAFGIDAPERLVTATSRVLELGLRIAAPFIALNFLVTLAFAVLGRAVPRMQVFVLSYSLRSLAGFALLAGSGGLLTRYLWPEFYALPLRLLELLPAAVS
ncbi:flagellar biosynthetic protein FliR [Rariglobus hedericola]|nr:flagellar biosynthetic protein FliR [Rariglobus hedericola]